MRETGDLLETSLSIARAHTRNHARSLEPSLHMPLLESELARNLQFMREPKYLFVIAHSVLLLALLC